ncbi:type VI secretion system baseplate subunit TssE [Acidisphaera rubrifaciens]|uniref:IraD/Gp25-like domain-containing protein n=1 Tax=Acidisphaera rubrifaciens HS-AP3 TaxID=1231350 RepID=A0A0D6P774_9PROT|nr:type VI secretion system baseplate subunit TssE [Acidisphaera rubrifaciens]GAN77176.1 hypothetical protein Asru_0249_07 [Acidisphaera rubrifaciens HS-AP3]
MFDRRLLERVRSGRAEARTTIDTSVLMDDVLRHLRELFNVRRGSVPIRPDYGMPDINDLIHLMPDAIDILGTELRRQIIAFEPRLRDVTVRHVPSEDRPDSLTYAISAALDVDGRRERMAVETQIGDNGRVRLGD